MTGRPYEEWAPTGFLGIASFWRRACLVAGLILLISTRFSARSCQFGKISEAEFSATHQLAIRPAPGRLREGPPAVRSR